MAWLAASFYPGGSGGANNDQDLVCSSVLLLVNGCNDTMGNKRFNGDEWRSASVEKGGRRG